MGTRTPRDNESPSSSALLLPRHRHSRRGSIASLSSLSQIDRETLSQALDHIHSTASQTDTLTTFNEFTAPPSASSVLDNKGITSDLQGGISGLYNRFRASVGNAKDASSAGNDDERADRLSVTNLTKSSPTPSTTAGATPTKSSRQALNLGAEDARAESLGRIPPSSPLPGSHVDLPTVEGQQTTPEAHLRLDDATRLRLPSISPITRAEGDDSKTVMAKPPDIFAKRINTPMASVATFGPAASEGLSARQETSLSQFRPAETPATVRRTEAFSSQPSFEYQSSHSAKKLQSVANSGKSSEATGSAEDSLSIKKPTIHSAQLGKGSTYLKGVPEGMQRTEEAKEQPTFEANEDFDDVPPMLAMDHEHVGSIPALSDQKGSNLARETKSRPQSLNLASHKSMAPPLVSHAPSPKRRSSRASSIDTNTDSLNSAAPQTPTHKSHEAMKATKRTLPIPELASRRDSRMMSSSSHSRNKVLSKEYWMKDENARDCFSCGEAFSTFRRKHHCRRFSL